MADQPGTIEVIARELAVALQPLEQRLSGDGQVEFLGELGLRLPGGFAQAATAIGNVAVKAGALAPLVVDLVDAIDDEDGAAIVAASFPLVTAIGDVIDAIASLEPAISAAVAAAGGLTPAQVTYLQARAVGAARPHARMDVARVHRRAQRGPVLRARDAENRRRRHRPR